MQRLLRLTILSLALAGPLWLPAMVKAETEEPVAITVTSVVDGATLNVVMADGANQPLRLIGIQPLENSSPGFTPPCFGPEATARLGELAAGHEATLEFDTARQDRAGRVLGYLWMVDEAGQPWMVNEQLLTEGYADQLAAPPNLRYSQRFDAAAQSAREQGLGLWSACAQPASSGAGVPVPPAPSGAMPVPPAPGDPAPPSTLLPGRPQVCDAAYPTVCIPPPPPVLTCADIRPRRFTVLQPDPHRLDPDGNGIGCEQ